jgi:serine/threonine-protein kinase PpkA
MMITPHALGSKTLEFSLSELEIPGLQLLNEIGQGGMARVYLAMQESLQRPVAVKFLNNPDSPGFHERFMNEGRYLAALSHSNIVEVYDVGEAHGHYYILMEYLPRGDLKRRIQRGIKSTTALKLTLKIAGCLDYLHGQGIVHRDLKPSNILFRADNNPVLTDFGIAKLLQDSAELTLGGSILGSPSYLSPEQAGFAAEIDGRSDLYSLGVILYEMLTGRRPYAGESFAAIIMAHQHYPIPRLPEQLGCFQPIIERLLAKRADERYQSGAELIQAIRMATSGEYPQTRRQEQNEAQARPEAPLVESDPVPENPRGPHHGPLIPLSMLLLSALLPVVSLNQGESLTFKPTPEARAVSAVTAGQEPATLSGTRTEPQLEPREPHTPPTRRPKLSEVDRLLSLAYQRMDSLRLSYPKGDSALKYFRDILDLEPDNMAAQAGIRQIVRWYIRKAGLALDHGDKDRARRYIHRARLINARHPKLAALQERLDGSPPADRRTYRSLQLLDN